MAIRSVSFEWTRRHRRDRDRMSSRDPQLQIFLTSTDITNICSRRISHQHRGVADLFPCRRRRTMSFRYQYRRTSTTDRTTNDDRDANTQSEGVQRPLSHHQARISHRYHHRSHCIIGFIIATITISRSMPSPAPVRLHDDAIDVIPEIAVVVGAPMSVEESTSELRSEIPSTVAALLNSSSRSNEAISTRNDTEDIAIERYQ